MLASLIAFYFLIEALARLTANPYLREIRFQEALKLLETKKGDFVKAISYSVGYKNVKYFSKKRFEKSHSEYLL